MVPVPAKRMQCALPRMLCAAGAGAGVLGTIFAWHRRRSRHAAGIGPGAAFFK